MKKINIDGIPETTSRRAMIEKAIALIQTDGAAALRDEYLGIKNYAHFGDQEHSTSYGMGPTHGYIVFRIARTEPNKGATLGDDEVYLLECVRDFIGLQEEPSDPSRQDNQTREMNLCGVLRRISRLSEVRDTYAAKVEAANVHTH